LRDWRATDPHVGKEPVYEGPFEPSYDGPEDWELAAAREKLKTWHLHISAGIDRFKKKEQVDTHQSIDLAYAQHRLIADAGRSVGRVSQIDQWGEDRVTWFFFGASMVLLIWLFVMMRVKLWSVQMKCAELNSETTWCRISS
jgi:hypothetical protein